MTPLLRRTFSSLLLVGLVACGGGGDEGDLSASGVVVQQDATSKAGLDRFNARRQEIGLSTLTRNSKLDSAAQGHSNYQAINRQISHYQTEGKPGFTGICLGDSLRDIKCKEDNVSRLETADYRFNYSRFSFGEVISRTASPAGAAAADALITAIYHRFVIFEPMFTTVGVGAASLSGGSTYFTTNFTSDGLNSGIGRGNVVVYPKNPTDPAEEKILVPRNFFSDQEVPDPVPSRNEVGFPISVHADVFSPIPQKEGVNVIRVQSFTVRPRNGTNLEVQNLWFGVDPETPSSAAAIVPLDVLAPNTVYEVEFSGIIETTKDDGSIADSIQVDRTWSFTTGS